MFRGLIVLGALTASIFAQTVPELGSFTHEGRTVWFEVQEGWAVAEGDILLGRAEGIDKGNASRAAAVPLNPNGSVPVWPQGEIYYTIDANVPNQRRIIDAIAHINSSTPVRLTPRTGQPNYVRFVRPTNRGTCSSFVGMRGGEQAINLGDLCSTGNTIHEIGHAVGLLHEQDRLDRNRWITIQYENLAKWDTLTFAQFTATLDAGYYDYDSIMHYTPYSLTRNIRPVILSVPLGIPVALRATFSPGDIDVIQRLYGVRPKGTIVTTMPEGLEIEVDGTKYTSPRSFDWTVGSTHTVAVSGLQTSTATPTRHRFVRWTDGGAQTHTFTASANTTVLAAAFSREHRVMADVGLGEGTTNVYPASADGYYPAGTKIRVNAVPAQGQQFGLWFPNINLEVFDIGLGSREFEIDLYGNLQVEAIFTDLPLTTIDVSPNDYSLVYVDDVPWTPPVSFAWEPGSRHTIDVDATAFNYDGTMRYRFQGWADGVSAPVREVVAGNTPASYTARYRSEAFVSVARTTGGQVLLNPGTSDGYFNGGSTLLLRAVPDAQRDLIFWAGDINGRGKDRAMLMDQPRLAMAVFGAPVPLFPFNAAHRRTSPYFDRVAATVTPLQMAAINVTGLTLRNPAAGTVVNSRFGTQLEGIRVLFDGVPAPIVRLSPPNEVIVMVPSSVAGKPSVLVEFERDGQVNGSIRFGVENTAPGIYTLDESGYGPAVARNADGSPNAPRNPAALGSEVVLRVTGAGLMDRALPDGATIGAPGSRPRNPIYVRINGVPAEVLSAEPVAGEINGILELKIRVPAGLISGDHPVQFIAGIWASPPYVTLSVR